MTFRKAVTTALGLLTGWVLFLPLLVGFTIAGLLLVATLVGNAAHTERSEDPGFTWNAPWTAPTLPATPVTLRHIVCQPTSGAPSYEASWETCPAGTSQVGR